MSQLNRPEKPPPRRKKYVPAVGPRLRRLLAVVFVLVALLAVNASFLASVSLLEWSTGEVYQNWFYLIMFLVHLVLGLLLTLPLIVFGLFHMRNAYQRSNRRAVRVGYGLFSVSLLVVITGFVLMRVDAGGLRLEVNDPAWRSAAYWAHVIGPLLAAWLFVLHRLAGRRLRWRVGLAWAGVAAVFAFFLLILQAQDPRSWNQVGNPRGDAYFQPSLARTVGGDFIPVQLLDNDRYCAECHQDVHRTWSESVHKFASFNNPAYTATVRETRRVLFERDGHVQAARFCAGCHDPVPFFAGEFEAPRFDDPDYDLASDRAANAGITCTVCHSISHINSPVGNADYTIDAPIHYPFAFSSNRLLRWVNRQLVKAKPEFHKKTFLKPLHRSVDFCGTCHKVHLPEELNAYKWLRGQNHQDSFWLSGVSGHNPASFYYPPQAETNCNGCHMPLLASQDFGARDFDSSGQVSIHDHQFPSANTAMVHLKGLSERAMEAHRAFLQGVTRVDIFGIKEGGSISGELTAPLRPQIPALRLGHTYLLETVIRTLKMGHELTQGTADSNQLWLEVEAESQGRTVGVSGATASDGTVEPEAYFVNAYVIDREGRRIDRRNAQDIFVALYNHQIPPGAADVVHYLLKVPDWARQELRLTVRLKYRKFDTRYLRFFQDDPLVDNDLPVVVMAEDSLVFPIAADGGQSRQVEAAASSIPEWERWNDYGIGLLRRQGRGELRQAAQAFRRVEALGRPDGPLNLARVFLREGLIQQDAPHALSRAQSFDPPAPQWTLLWLSALIDKQNGRLDEAVGKLRELIKGGFVQAEGRGFDFSKDYRVLNELAETLRRRALQENRRNPQREALLREALEWYEKTLGYDPENLAAHWGLQQIHRALGDRAQAEHHAALHAKYKPDDNARDRAVAVARREDPAADRAAEPVAIYRLKAPKE